jgi:hypothetical protein
VVMMQSRECVQPSAEQLLLFGTDRVIRARLVNALDSERITPQGLRTLRCRYRLTPAETSVFIEYYLAGNDLSDRSPSIRRALAEDLNLSENTLMHHITSIRRKLGFAGRKGSASVLVWCLSAGITELRSLLPERATPSESGSDWAHALRA